MAVADGAHNPPKRLQLSGSLSPSSERAGSPVPSPVQSVVNVSDLMSPRIVRILRTDWTSAVAATRKATSVALRAGQLRRPPSLQDQEDGINESQFVRVLLPQARDLTICAGSGSVPDTTIIMQLLELFDMIDADGSGLVTWEEFSTACLQMAAMAQASQSGEMEQLRYSWKDVDMPRGPSVQRVCGTITACKFVPDLQQLFVCDDASSVVRVISRCGRLIANLHAYLPRSIKTGDRRLASRSTLIGAVELDAGATGHLNKWQRLQLQQNQVRMRERAWAIKRVRQQLPARPGLATLAERLKAARIVGNEFSNYNTAHAEDITADSLISRTMKAFDIAEQANLHRTSASFGQGFVPQLVSHTRKGPVAADPEARKQHVASTAERFRTGTASIPPVRGNADSSGCPTGWRMNLTPATLSRRLELHATKEVTRHAAGQKKRLATLRKLYVEQAETKLAQKQAAADRQAVVAKTAVLTTKPVDPFHLPGRKAMQPPAQLPPHLQAALARAMTLRKGATPGGEATANSDAVTTQGTDEAGTTTHFRDNHTPFRISDGQDRCNSRAAAVSTTAGTTASTRSAIKTPLAKPAAFIFEASETGRVADVGNPSEDWPDPFLLKNKGLRIKQSPCHLLGVEFCRPKRRSTDALVWQRLSDADAEHLLAVTISEGAILTFNTRSFSFRDAIITLEQHCLPTWADAANALFTAATFSSDIFAWDLLAGSKLAHFRAAHSDVVTCLVWEPRTSLAVSGGADGKLQLWDGGNKVPSKVRAAASLDGQTYGIKHAAIIPQGPSHLVTIGFKTSENYLWNLASRTRLCNIIGHGSPIIGVVVMHDAPFAAITADEYGTFRVWATQDSSLAQCPQLHAVHSSSPEFTIEGFTSQSPSGDIVPWSNHAQLMKRFRVGSIAPVPSNVIFSSVLASFVVSVERGIRVYSADTGALQREMPELMGDTIVSLALDQRERKLIVGDADGQIKQFSLASGVFLKKATEPHRDDVTNIEPVPEDGIYVTASWDRSIAAYLDEGDSMQLLRQTEYAHSADISAMSVSRSANLIATGAVDGTVRLWHMDTFAQAMTLDSHPGPVSDMEFAAPNDLVPVLVSSDQTGIIRVYAIPPSPLGGQLLVQLANIGLRGAALPPHMEPGLPAPTTELPEREELARVPITALEIFVDTMTDTQDASQLIFWVFTGDAQGRLQWWDLSSLIRRFNVGLIQEGRRACDLTGWDPLQERRRRLPRDGPEAYDPSKAGAAEADVARRRRELQRQQAQAKRKEQAAKEVAEAERKARLQAKIEKHKLQLQGGRRMQRLGARVGSRPSSASVTSRKATPQPGPASSRAWAPNPAAWMPPRARQAAKIAATVADAVAEGEGEEASDAAPTEKVEALRMTPPFLQAADVGSKAWHGFTEMEDGPGLSEEWTAQVVAWAKHSRFATVASESTVAAAVGDESRMHGRRSSVSWTGRDAFLAKRQLPGLRPRLEFTAHTDYITCLRFVSDPQSLVSCSQDGSVRIWQIDGSPIGIVMCPPPQPLVVQKASLATPSGHNSCGRNGTGSGDDDDRAKPKQVNLFKHECPWGFTVDHQARLGPLRRRAMMQQESINPLRRAPKSPIARRMWKLLGRETDSTIFSTETDKQHIAKVDAERRRIRHRTIQSLVQLHEPELAERTRELDAAGRDRVEFDAELVSAALEASKKRNTDLLRPVTKGLSRPPRLSGFAASSVTDVHEQAVRVQAGLELARERNHALGGGRTSQLAHAARRAMRAEAVASRLINNQLTNSAVAQYDAKELATQAATATDSDIIATFHELDVAEQAMLAEARASASESKQRKQAHRLEQRHMAAAVTVHAAGLQAVDAGQQDLAAADPMVLHAPVPPRMIVNYPNIAAVARDKARCLSATRRRWEPSNGSKPAEADQPSGLLSGSEGMKEWSLGEASGLKAGTVASANRPATAVVLKQPSSLTARATVRPASAAPAEMRVRRATKQQAADLVALEDTLRRSRQTIKLARRYQSTVFPTTIRSRPVSAHVPISSRTQLGIRPVSAHILTRSPKEHEINIGDETLADHEDDGMSQSVAASADHRGPSQRPKKSVARPPRPSTAGDSKAACLQITGQQPAPMPTPRNEQPASALPSLRRAQPAPGALEMRKQLWQRYGRVRSISSDGLPLTFGPVSREQVQSVTRLFLQIDQDASGEASVEEFLNNPVLEASGLAQFSRSLFRTLDTDNSGTITLRELLRAAFPDITPAQFRSLATYGDRFHREQFLATKRLVEATSMPMR